MKRSILSTISIVSSTICIVAVFKIYHDILVQYLSSDGKTKALFGIIEITQFSYKYYFLSLIFLSILFAILAILKKEKRSLIILAFILSSLSIISIFVDLWRFMI
jgi:hypothetical protein